MFFRSKAQVNAAQADLAFERARTSAVELGQAVAGRIVTEYRAGRIDRAGVDQRVELALHQAASAPGAPLPSFMLRAILETLHASIAAELAAAGISVAALPGEPAP